MGSSVKIITLGMHNRPELGGVDRYFYDLSHALALELESFAFGFDDGVADLPEYDKGTIQPLGLADQRLVHRLDVIKKVLGPQLCGDTMLVSHFALYAFALRRKLVTTPHVVHFHGPWAEESRAEGAKPWVVFAKKWIEKQAYRTADRFICLCDPFKQILVKNYGADSDKIEIVPGGVHAAEFDTGLSRVEARAQLGWPEDAPLILCVRRLARRMGIDNLIEAFASIAAQFPKATLMLGGKGPRSEELKSLIESWGLQNRVRLMGFIPSDQLALAYRAADCSIVPSRSLEGFGLITLESLAAGTPVLVTPVGGLPSAVSGLDENLVLEGTDVSSLAKGLSQMLSGGTPLPRTSACQSYVRNNYDWSVIAPRILAVYRGMILKGIQR